MRIEYFPNFKSVFRKVLNLSAPIFCISRRKHKLATIRLFKIKTFLLTLFVLVTAAEAGAQAGDFTLTPAITREVVTQAAMVVEDAYVFPDVGLAMAVELRRALAAKEYDDISAPQKLAEKITEQFMAVSKDKHMFVVMTPEVIPLDYDFWEEVAEPSDIQKDYDRRRNYGFNKVERLVGNIGYIEYNEFSGIEGAEPVFAATMEFLKYTGGLIIDLRNNGGGSPDTVELLSGYLLSDERVNLGSWHYRKDNEVKHILSTAKLDGPRYGAERPVYILTGKNTFSAAEAFAYDMQARERAIVIGEVTAGGALPGEMRRLQERFLIRISTAHVIHPITGTDFEGVGVIPDHPVAPADALKVAQEMMLEQLIAEALPSPAREEREYALRLLKNEE